MENRSLVPRKNPPSSTSNVVNSFRYLYNMDLKFFCKKFRPLITRCENSKSTIGTLFLPLLNFLKLRLYGQSFGR